MPDDKPRRSYDPRKELEFSMMEKLMELTQQAKKKEEEEEIALRKLAAELAEALHRFQTAPDALTKEAAYENLLKVKISDPARAALAAPEAHAIAETRRAEEERKKAEQERRRVEEEKVKHEGLMKAFLESPKKPAEEPKPSRAEQGWRMIEEERLRRDIEANAENLSIKSMIERLIYGPEKAKKDAEWEERLKRHDAFGRASLESLRKIEEGEALKKALDNLIKSGPAKIKDIGKPAEEPKLPRLSDGMGVYGMMKTLEWMVSWARSGFLPYSFLQGKPMDSEEAAIVLASVYSRVGWFTRFKAVGRKAKYELAVKPGKFSDKIAYDHVFVEVFHPWEKEWIVLDPLHPDPWPKGTPWYGMNVSYGMSPEEAAKRVPPLEFVYSNKEFANVPGGSPDPAIYLLVHMTELGKQVDWLKLHIETLPEALIAEYKNRVRGLLNLLELIRKDLREHQSVVLERPHRKEEPWNKEES